MNILITGINGFVGSNFVSNWADKHILWGLDINKTSKTGVAAIYDWNDLPSIRGMEAVVHLAGKAHDLKNKSLAQSYFDINTGLTQQIFDWFLESDAKVFVFFSSVKAAADSAENTILTEDVVPNPIGPYGESKIKAEENILNKLSDIKYQNSDKRVYILRPAMIHGPGNKGNLNLLFQIVKKGIPWPLGAFDNQRSFCSIDNISFVVEKLIATPTVASGIYHICDDEALSTNQLIRIISQTVGKKTPIMTISPNVIKTIATLGQKLHLPLTTERLTKLTENYVVSNKKIKSALNIDSMPVSASDGLRKTIKSFI